MTNYFNGINIGYKALQVQKKSLDITGHNIANANNEGYNRQRAVHKATEPYPVPGLHNPTDAGQMGTGVEMAEIERIIDQFIESQIREESQGQGYWDQVSEGMSRIEMILNEPSDSSLDSSLENFWQSLQDLSNQPTDEATRVTVRQRGMVLVDSFHTLFDQLNDYQRSLNHDVGSTVNEINSTANRIADLNKQIVSVKASGKNPNDLLDERQLLFGRLNKHIDVQGQEDSRGNLNINIGGVGLVNGVETRELAVERDTSAAKSQDKIIFKDSGEEVDLRSGQLAGTIYIRNEVIEQYKDELDTVAEGFINEFNEVHKTGYGLNGEQGHDFFVIKDDYDHEAAGIDISGAIKDDLNNIASGNYSDRPEVAVVYNDSGDPDAMYQVAAAAGSGSEDFDYEIFDENGISIDSGSANKGEEIDLSGSEGVRFYLKSAGTANISLSGNPGSGTNGIALANAIKKGNVISESSIADYYESVIASLGVEAERANNMVENQDVMVNQLENQRKSISGVSLDEEMANIIKYQQAYNAAAKIVTKTDELLETLNGMVR